MADPGFSPRGGANSQNCYYFSHFCQKLHENEKIWTPGGGGGASLAPPLGSTNGLQLLSLNLLDNYLLLPPATKLGQGYIFTGVCDSINRGACMMAGGMHGCWGGTWLGSMCGCEGCVVAGGAWLWGGHAWLQGVHAWDTTR